MLEKDGFGRRQKIEDNPRTCAVQRHHIPASKVYKKSQFVQKEKEVTNKGIGDAGSTADFRML